MYVVYMGYFIHRCTSFTWVILKHEFFQIKVKDQNIKSLRRKDEIRKGSSNKSLRQVCLQAVQNKQTWNSKKKIFKTVDIVMYCVDLFLSNKPIIKAYPIIRLKSLSNEYDFKWNQSYLSRGSKSLNFNSHSPRVGFWWLKLKNVCLENPLINQTIKSAKINANWSTIKKMATWKSTVI